MLIRTKRLLLRPWRQSDASDLFILASNPAIGPNAGWKPHKNEKDSTAFIESTQKNPFEYAVCTEEDGRLIGSVVLRSNAYSMLRLDPDEAELGCWIGQPYWQKGYALESLRALLHYAFDVLSLARIFAVSYRDNEASIRLQTAAGFTDDGWHIKDMRDVQGVVHAGSILVLTKERWKKIRQSRSLDAVEFVCFEEESA